MAKTVQQIIEAQPGFWMISYIGPSEAHPDPSYGKHVVIGWALIEEVTPDGYGHTSREHTIEPVTVDSVGWPNLANPLAILAPDGSVQMGGDRYSTVAVWLSEMSA